MRKADKLIKFFSKGSIDEIKIIGIRNIVRDIVNKSEKAPSDKKYLVSDSQYDTLVKAKTWVYRHRKSRGEHGKPAKVKVFTKEEIERYQSSN